MPTQGKRKKYSLTQRALYGEQVTNFSYIYGLDLIGLAPKFETLLSQSDELDKDFFDASTQSHAFINIYSSFIEKIFGIFREDIEDDDMLGELLPITNGSAWAYELFLTEMELGRNLVHKELISTQGKKEANETIHLLDLMLGGHFQHGLNAAEKSPQWRKAIKPYKLVALAGLYSIDHAVFQFNYSTEAGRNAARNALYALSGRLVNFLAELLKQKAEDESSTLEFDLNVISQKFSEIKSSQRRGKQTLQDRFDSAKRSVQESASSRWAAESAEGKPLTLIKYMTEQLRISIENTIQKTGNFHQLKRPPNMKWIRDSIKQVAPPELSLGGRRKSK